MPPIRQTATETLPEFAGHIVGKDRYHLQKKLGSGAYGKVYRALDLLAEPKPIYCAVKVLHCHPKGSRREKAQHREVTLQVKATGHPNIVSLFDYFANPLYVFVVLELCSGGDLFSAITEKHWYQDEPARIKATFLQILDAVEHCHALHIFHRDIKPENILCSSDGSIARLADFGLSTVQRLSNEFGCGSSYYMSPECIGGGLGGHIKEYSTAHNDIWALGIIFTNLATSRNPWRYATVDDGCFAAFLKDENFLKEALPISSGMNSILKSIFTRNWRHRLSIPQLRERVINLKTIYSTKHAMDNHIVEAPPTVPVETSYYDAPDAPPTPFPRDEAGVRSPWPGHTGTDASRGVGVLAEALGAFGLGNGHTAGSDDCETPVTRTDSPTPTQHRTQFSDEVHARTPPKRQALDTRGRTGLRNSPLGTKTALAPPTNSDSTGSSGTSGPVTPQTHALFELPPDEHDFRLNSSVNPAVWGEYGASPGEKGSTKMKTQGYCRTAQRDPSRGHHAGSGKYW